MQEASPRYGEYPTFGNAEKWRASQIAHRETCRDTGKETFELIAFTAGCGITLDEILTRTYVVGWVLPTYEFELPRWAQLHPVNIEHNYMATNSPKQQYYPTLLQLSYHTCGNGRLF